jgi:hypothetical protein
MKKLLSISILLILLFPAFAYAGGAMGLMMGAASGGAAQTCTIYKDATQSTPVAIDKIGYSTTYSSAGQGEWTPDSGTVSICRVDIQLQGKGDPSAIEYVARVWTMSGTSLNTQIGVDSATLTGVTGGDAVATYTLTFTTPVSATNNGSTLYAIVLHRLDGGYDTTNYIIPYRGATATDYLTGQFRLWAANKANADTSTPDCYMDIWTMQ